MSTRRMHDFGSIEKIYTTTVAHLVLRRRRRLRLLLSIIFSAFFFFVFLVAALQSSFAHGSLRLIVCLGIFNAALFGGCGKRCLLRVLCHRQRTALLNILQLPLRASNESWTAELLPAVIGKNLVQFQGDLRRKKKEAEKTIMLQLYQK